MPRYRPPNVLGLVLPGGEPDEAILAARAIVWRLAPMSLAMRSPASTTLRVFLSITRRLTNTRSQPGSQATPVLFGSS